MSSLPEFVINIADSPEAASTGAARAIAAQMQLSLAQHPIAVLAFSGGTTPSLMFDELARSDGIDWARVVITQVDERLAPAGSPDRNLTQLDNHLLAKIAIPRANVVPLPIDEVSVTPEAIRGYVRRIEALSNRPFALDVVHLGLGVDGHTASLIPGDPVLEDSDDPVAMAGEYAGRRRITLTYPALRGAHCVVWLVTGRDKADQVRRLVAGDASTPAGALKALRNQVFVDQAAASAL